MLYKFLFQIESSPGTPSCVLSRNACARD
jgi:hypothetical protein